MFKTFVLGIIIGLAGLSALLYLVPAVDLYRELSHVTVLPNGGNVETFHIDLPRDRVLAGMPSSDNAVPAGLQWPNDEILHGSQTEIFKLRDRSNTVIGLASRMASSAEPTGAFTEWTLHLPARGSMFVAMQLDSSEQGYRSGVLRGGTGEFATLSGEFRESLLTDVSDAVMGIDYRVQLVSVLTGLPEDME